jgi:hypothetical protein
MALLLKEHRRNPTRRRNPPKRYSDNTSQIHTVTEDIHYSPENLFHIHDQTKNYTNEKQFVSDND